MIRLDDGTRLDSNELHFGLFMRAIKDAPRDMVSVHVEGTEVGFCGDVLADQIRKLRKERDEARKEAEKWRDKAEGLLDDACGYELYGELGRLPWKAERRIEN